MSQEGSDDSSKASGVRGGHGISPAIDDDLLNKLGMHGTFRDPEAKIVYTDEMPWSITAQGQKPRAMLIISLPMQQPCHGARNSQIYSKYLSQGQSKDGKRQGLISIYR